MYTKDPDYCPQTLQPLDCSYERPRNDHDGYRNGTDHSTTPNGLSNLGAVSYNKMDACEIVYPSNHERVPFLSEQQTHVLVSDSQGNCEDWSPSANTIIETLSPHHSFSQSFYKRIYEFNAYTVFTGSHLEPLIRSPPPDLYHQPPAQNCFLQQISHLADPLHNEGAAKEPPLSNGHALTAQHKPHSGSDDSK